jgi:hypothetical protein
MSNKTRINSNWIHDQTREIYMNNNVDRENLFTFRLLKHEIAMCSNVKVEEEETNTL